MPEAEPDIRDETGATPSGAFERLRRILLGDERAAISAADARLRALERAQEDLPARLPAAIERAERDARLDRALARPVARALGAAVQENRQVVVDVLFPVIGPAIRKAIAEALRTLVSDLNGALESSLTLRGIAWRIEAWRSGVPYAQVVLKHRLRWRIDHVFLIERDSGLVLARESAPDLAELDADAIAGMLTAIGAFVRDSLGGDDSAALEAARVGDHVLWVVEGPRANLACFIRGVPPAALRELLEQRLEAIHAAGAAAPRALDDETRASLRPAELDESLRAIEPPRRARPSRWPIAIVLLVLLASALWLGFRAYAGRAAIDALRARLAAHPGFILTGIDERGGTLTVHGLLDPDAAPLAAANGARTDRVAFDTRGYLSTDDTIVERRARRVLDMPPNVTADVRNGVLSLKGSAKRDWIEAARARAAWIAGVRSVDVDVAAVGDPAAAARAELESLARAVSLRHVAFARDAEPDAQAPAIVDRIVEDVRRARTLARTAGIDIAWVAVGTNDAPGSDEINARMRAVRARWLIDALSARGIEVEAAPADDAESLAVRERGAFVRMIERGTPR